MCEKKQTVNKKLEPSVWFSRPYAVSDIQRCLRLSDIKVTDRKAYKFMMLLYYMHQGPPEDMPEPDYEVLGD